MRTAPFISISQRSLVTKANIQTFSKENFTNSRNLIDIDKIKSCFIPYKNNTRGIYR